MIEPKAIEDGKEKLTIIASFRLSLSQAQYINSKAKYYSKYIRNLIDKDMETNA